MVFEMVFEYEDLKAGPSSVVAGPGGNPDSEIIVTKKRRRWHQR